MKYTDKELAAMAAEIREGRKARGWTQAELAQSSHLTLGTIQNLEAAKYQPRKSTIALVWAALKEEGSE